MPMIEENHLAPPRRLQVMGNINYRLIFLGSSISRLGDGLTPVAFALGAYSIARSASGITEVLLSLWLVRFLMVPVAGRVPNRIGAAQTIVVADGIRIVAQAGLGFVLISPIQPSMVPLCISAGFYGLGASLFPPAQSRLFRDVVQASELQSVNALTSIVGNLANLIGPGAAGLLWALTSFSTILFIDSASFVVNILCVSALIARVKSLRVRQPEEARGRPARLPDHFAAAVRQTKEFPWFRRGILLWFTISFSIGLVSVAGPVTAINRLGGTTSWSVLATAMAVGGLLGSVGVVASTRAWPWCRLAGIVAAAVMLQLVLLALSSFIDLILVAVIFVISSMSIAIAGVVWDTKVQREVPEDLVSPFVSLESFSDSVGIPVGIVTGGLFASHYGLTLSIVAVAVIAAGLVASVLPSNYRQPLEVV